MGISVQRRHRIRPDAGSRDHCFDPSTHVANLNVRTAVASSLLIARLHIMATIHERSGQVHLPNDRVKCPRRGLRAAFIEIWLRQLPQSLCVLRSVTPLPHVVVLRVFSRADAEEVAHHARSAAYFRPDKIRAIVTTAGTMVTAAPATITLGGSFRKL